MVGCSKVGEVVSCIRAAGGKSRVPVASTVAHSCHATDWGNRKQDIRFMETSLAPVLPAIALLGGNEQVLGPGMNVVKK